MFPLKRLLRGLESGEEGGKMLTDIAYKLGELVAQIQHRDNVEVKPAIQTQITNLQERLSEKDKEIADLKEAKKMSDFKNMISESLDPVLKEIAEIKKGQSQTTDALVQAVRSTEAIVKEGTDIYKTYVRARFGMSEERPKRQKVEAEEGKPTIYDLVPEEYKE